MNRLSPNKWTSIFFVEVGVLATLFWLLYIPVIECPWIVDFARSERNYKPWPYLIHIAAIMVLVYHFFVYAGILVRNRNIRAVSLTGATLMLFNGIMVYIIPVLCISHIKSQPYIAEEGAKNLPFIFSLILPILSAKEVNEQWVVSWNHLNVAIVNVLLFSLLAIFFYMLTRTIEEKERKPGQIHNVKALAFFLELGALTAPLCAIFTTVASYNSFYISFFPGPDSGPSTFNPTILSGILGLHWPSYRPLFPYVAAALITGYHLSTYAFSFVKCWKFIILTIIGFLVMLINTAIWNLVWLGKSHWITFELGGMEISPITEMWGGHKWHITGMIMFNSMLVVVLTITMLSVFCRFLRPRLCAKSVN